MIVIRDGFQLKFGQARPAIALAQEGLGFMRRREVREMRVLTDRSGAYYTLVFESAYDSLASYEADMQSETADPRWKDWYARFAPHVDSGRREIFTLVGGGASSLPTADQRAQATAGRG